MPANCHSRTPRKDDRAITPLTMTRPSGQSTIFHLQNRRAMRGAWHLLASLSARHACHGHPILTALVMLPVAPPSLSLSQMARSRKTLTLAVRFVGFGFCRRRRSVKGQMKVMKVAKDHGPACRRRRWGRKPNKRIETVAS